MKILDSVLILAVLATAVLSATNIKQINPPQALPVLVTAGGQPAAPGDTPTNIESPQPRASSTAASPVVQVTVGLVCVVFGAIACYPLFTDTKIDH